MPLAEGEVHLWLCAAESAAEAARGLSLFGGSTDAWAPSREERDRAARFVRAHDGARFLAGRIFLRAVLSRYLRAAPGSFELRAGSHGKPELAGREGSIPLSFNLSHSRTTVAVALARSMPVGVDVEDIDAGQDVEGLAQVAMSPAERALLATSAPERRPRLFYAAWVRKEAVLKACGLGMGAGPSRVEALRPDAVGGADPDPRVRASDRPVACAAPDGVVYGVRDVDVGPDRGGAVAAPGVEWALRLCRARSD